MNDPHVVALIYRVEHSKSVDYREAKPLRVEESAFRVKVRGNRARVELKDHYATEADARAAIAAYIQCWTFAACLNRGPNAFRLCFERSEIEDRNPTPGVADVRWSLRTGSPTVSIVPSVFATDYPAPVEGIDAADPNVQSMYCRYLRYQRGEEPLPGMAYFCLTVLEHTMGKAKGRRKAASKMYSIDKSVLDTVARLSTERGGRDARKALAASHELAPDERTFLICAIRQIIFRAAERAFAPHKQLPLIRLGDLPKISHP